MKNNEDNEHPKAAESDESPIEVVSPPSECNDALDDEQKRVKALQLKDEGNAHFKSGNYDASFKSYLTALEVCPSSEIAIRTILYSNLAAAKDHLEAHEEAIAFCSEALALTANHTKALIRRAKLYRKCDKLDESLKDYEQYHNLVPDDRDASRTIYELKRDIEIRNEKMKTEVLGKLKDLGNMVLKPFGLSTDNFNLVQNPENGSYSVNFQK